MADVQNQAPEAGPTIGLTDLQNAVKVIDYACEQGAFKGWQTIEQVSAVRRKLMDFIQAATPADELVEEPATEVTETTEAPKKARTAKVKADKAVPTVKKVTAKPAGAKK